MWCTRLDPIEQLDRARTEALLRETAAAAAEVGRAETWLAMERADTRAIWGGFSTKGGEPSGHDAAAMATLQEMLHLGTTTGDEARPDAGTPTEAVVPATRRLPMEVPAYAVAAEARILWSVGPVPAIVTLQEMMHLGTATGE